MTKGGQQGSSNIRSTIAQLVAALAFSILCISEGFVIGMPTIVIGALKIETSTNSSEMVLSEDEASWFGSIVFIVQPLGSLICGIMQHVLGRRMSLLLINIPQLAAWTVIYFATSTTELYLAIAVMSASLGFMEAPIISYIGESTEPRLRGIFCTFITVFYSAGLMLEGFLGAAMHWRTMILCNMAGPITSFIVMLMVPESPAWLLTKGRVREAEKAFQWLRGWVPPEAVKEEMDSLVSYVSQMKAGKGVEYTAVSLKDGETRPPPSKPDGLWKTILDPNVLVAFRIIFIYFFVSFAVSLLGPRPFLIEILQNMKSPLDPNFVVGLLGVLLLIGSATMGLGLKILGKRRLSFLSLGLCVVSCLGVGFYLLFEIDKPWLPLIFFGINYLSSSLGCQCIPWILVSELFPLKARGLASGICAAVGFIIIFVVTKTYYNLLHLVGESGVYMVYALVGLLGIVYLYFDMIETEGIPLEEIERIITERHAPKRKKQIIK